MSLNNSNNIMKQLHLMYQHSKRHFVSIEKQADKKIINIVLSYLQDHQVSNFIPALLAHCLYEQNWFDADIGLHHLMFEMYSLIYGNHNQSKLKKLARKYQSKKGINDMTLNDTKEYLKKHPHSKSVNKYYGYCFECEPEIVSMLWNSFTARDVAYVWLNTFIRIKARYAMETHASALITCRQAKRTCFLLHGLVLADNKMHIARYKNMPKTIIAKQEWIKKWKKYVKYDINFWD